MLTHVDIDHFKQQLQAQQKELQQRIAALNQDLASPDQWVEAEDERGDDAVFLRNHDDDWDQLAFTQAELAQVKKALARIEAGTYGISEVSSKPIPRERLEADPAATTLVGEVSG
jgi:RNA polymerase-binding transcription factor DksA